MSLQELYARLGASEVTAFGVRLAAAMQAGTAVPGNRPAQELLTAWGLSTDADGSARSRICVEPCGFAVVKPQVAFFETYGAAGYSVLDARSPGCARPGVVVLADAKRGDIGFDDGRLCRGVGR